MMNADLHIHSTFSDGSATIPDIIAEALEHKLDCISITDHDTTEGTAEAIALGRAAGIMVVPGIEISSFDYKRRRKAHLLGYAFKECTPSINAVCAPLLERRHENSLRNIARLAAAGFPVSVDDVHAIAGPGRIIYKQHIMSALVKNKAAASIHSPLYRELFKGNGLCAEEIEYIDVFEAMSAIHADGGKAVLAHPGQLCSWDLAEELIAAGLDGIEYYHESHSSRDYKRLDAILSKHPHLIRTGGSDYHGAYGSIRLTIGDFRAPASFSGFFIPFPDTLSAAAADIVKEAGCMLRRASFTTQSPMLKNGDCHDVVTDCDRAVEILLADKLKTLLPGSSVMGEEHENGETIDREAIWIIDPIDGTINFLKLRSGFAISVALYRNGQPQFGIVYDVMADKLWSAAPGHGAFCNGERLIPCPAVHSPEEAVIDISLHSLAHLEKGRCSLMKSIAPLIRGHRSYGCASLSLCAIAAGRLDAYLSAHIRIWDYAAAAIVLTETGGCFAAAPPATTEGPAPQRFIAAASKTLLERLLFIIMDETAETTLPIFEGAPPPSSTGVRTISL